MITKEGDTRCSQAAQLAIAGVPKRGKANYLSAKETSTLLTRVTGKFFINLYSLFMFFSYTKSIYRLASQLIDWLQKTATLGELKHAPALVRGRFVILSMLCISCMDCSNFGLVSDMSVWISGPASMSVTKRTQGQFVNVR